MTEVENQTIGDALKNRRKELNISLKEVETGTSIRMSYLLAIEESDLSKLISPIYAQGFIKQYASFLGLDGEELVRSHQDLFQQNKPHDFAYGIGTLEMRGNPGAKMKGIPNYLWVLAFGLLLGVAWYVAKMFEVI